MPYTVKPTKRAAKELRKLPADVRRRAVDAIDQLATDQAPPGVKHLKGPYKGYRRIFVGRSYRVIYSVDDAARSVEIMSVRHRESGY